MVLGKNAQPTFVCFRAKRTKKYSVNYPQKTKNSWGWIQTHVYPSALWTVPNVKLSCGQFNREGVARCKRVNNESCVTRLRCETTACGELPAKNTQKNSWGWIRTVDLAGMSRTLSPTELLSHLLFILLLKTPYGVFNSGGQGWIRTTVPSREQIYSLSPLATRPPTHI